MEGTTGRDKGGRRRAKGTIEEGGEAITGKRSSQEVVFVYGSWREGHTGLLAGHMMSYMEAMSVTRR